MNIQLSMPLSLFYLYSFTLGGAATLILSSIHPFQERLIQTNRLRRILKLSTGSVSLYFKARLDLYRDYNRNRFLYLLPMVTAACAAYGIFGLILIILQYTLNLFTFLPITNINSFFIFLLQPYQLALIFCILAILIYLRLMLFRPR